MRKFLLVLSLSSLFYLNGESLPFDGEGFGIDQSRKGYLKYYLQDSEEKIQLLDDGGYLNSRIYIKDSDSRFYLRNRSKHSIKRVDDTLIIKWRAEFYDIIERYKFIPTGFNYSIEIENRTDRERSVGVYLIYDTILGEKSKNHFTVNTYNIIKNEQLYSGREIPESVKSVNESGQGLEFRVMDGETNKPEHLILGNWDRLAYSRKWPYKPLDGGLFSYGYYSINDSGVGIVYPEVNLPVKSKIIYSFDLNFLNNQLIESETETSADEVEDGKDWNKEEEPEDSSVVDDETVVDSTEEYVEGDDGIVVNVEVIDNTIISPDVDPDRVTSDSDESVTDNSGENSGIDDEELARMLEYVQKKKRGEDVSEYNFTEEEILNKLQK